MCIIVQINMIMSESKIIVRQASLNWKIEVEFKEMKIEIIDWT